MTKVRTNSVILFGKSELQSARVLFSARKGPLCGCFFDISGSDRIVLECEKLHVQNVNRGVVWMQVDNEMDPFRSLFLGG